MAQDCFAEKATRIMPRKLRLEEQDIVSSSNLLKMAPEDAIAEIMDQVLEFKIYAARQDLQFLAYLLEMAEIEARQMLSNS